MSVGHHAKKFNTVSNDNGRMQKCDLFVLEQKYRFWANLVQKIKIVTLAWKLVSRLIPTCTIQWWYSVFPYSIENFLFGYIWFKEYKISF